MGANISISVPLFLVFLFYIISYLLARKWKKNVVEIEGYKDSSKEKAELTKELYDRYWKPRSFTIRYFLNYIGQSFIRTTYVLFMPLHLIQSFKYSSSEAAIFMAIAMLPWAVKWPWGVISDVFPLGSYGRRRPYIAIFTTLVIVSLLICAFAQSPVVILLCGMLIFLFIGGVDATVDGFLMDVVPPDYHGWVMGGAASAGMAIGSGLSAVATAYLIENYTYTYAFLVSAVFSAVTLTFLNMKEPPLVIERRATRNNFALAFTDKHLWLGFALFMLSMSGAITSPMTGLFGLVLTQVVGVSPALIAYITIARTPIDVVGSFFGGKLSDKVGHRKTLLIGLPLLSIVIAAWSLLSYGMILAAFVLTFLMSIANSLISPPKLALAADLCPPYMPATVFQIFMSSLAIGGTFGKIAYGISIDSFGWITTIYIIALLTMAEWPLLVFVRSYSESKASKV